ncbi:MAG: hypothetical protein AVDCRST_MAG06-1513, partial [uncultured Nocardioides sp.]
GEHADHLDRDDGLPPGRRGAPLGRVPGVRLGDPGQLLGQGEGV